MMKFYREYIESLCPIEIFALDKQLWCWSKGKWILCTNVLGSDNTVLPGIRIDFLECCREITPLEVLDLTGSTGPKEK